MPGYQNPPLETTGKLQVACQSPHLGKIQGMKSLSEPRLPIEIYIFKQIMSTIEFRKKRLPFWEFAPKPLNLPPSPTNTHRTKVGEITIMLRKPVFKKQDHF
jgi:hypothetical protein